MAGNWIIERIYSSECEQSNAINAAADRQCTRKDMAEFYRDCLIADTIAKHNGLERVDFHKVNNAILERWPKGLTFIKELAWKRLGQQ